MNNLIYKTLYLLLIFVYISLRIFRDSSIIFAIGPEGTAVAKFISLFCVFIFAFIQKKALNKYSINKVFLFMLIGFIITLLLVDLNLIGDNNLELHFFPKLIKKLINKTSVLLVYILSELFAVFIATNFWLLCNTSRKILTSKEKKNNFFYNQMFVIAQLGVLLSACFCILFQGVSLKFIIIALTGVFIIAFKIPNFYNTNKELNSEKITKFSKIDTGLLFIPLMTVLCGMIAGIIDPYTKFQLKKISVNAAQYQNRISTILILQAIFSMILGEVLKFRFFVKKLLTQGFLIIFLTLALILKNNIEQFYFSIFCAVIVLTFKSLKYSAFSPVKEEFIQTNQDMQSILIFDGISGRFGKNLIAILLVIIFNLGFTWYDIENTSLIISIVLSMFWFMLSFKIV